MVAQQFLVLFVVVRIRLGQQKGIFRQRKVPFSIYCHLWIEHGENIGILA